jgi:hypothetical protein
MTIEGIFDRAKAMAKIKFDAESASVPSSLNISDAEMEDIANSLYEYTQKKREETTRLSYGVNNEEVKVGQILRRSEFLNNREEYVIVTWIDSGEPDRRTGFPTVQTKILNFDGTLGDVCVMLPFNPKTVQAVTDEEFRTWADKMMRENIRQIKETIRREQMNLRDSKKEYNKFDDTFKNTLNKFRNW